MYYKHKQRCTWASGPDERTAASHVSGKIKERVEDALQISERRKRERAKNKHKKCAAAAASAAE